MNSAPIFGSIEHENARILVDLAIDEDLGTVGDVTATVTIPEGSVGVARFMARTYGVVAGLPVVALVIAAVDPSLQFDSIRIDGDSVNRGDVLARVAGPMRSLLAAERTALNFLQRLSGVASLTSRFVAEVAGTKAVILDTRKTTPGWRALEKYAVRCGGGTNHRIGLYDAILIKDNHLAHLGIGSDPIGQSLRSARTAIIADLKFVEIEVDNLDQFDRALHCLPDIILIDNLGADALAEAVRRRDEKSPGVLLEASGGITLATVGSLAQSGVDRISVGALTHSAPALDIGLDYGEATEP